VTVASALPFVLLAVSVWIRCYGVLMGFEVMCSSCSGDGNSWLGSAEVTVTV
jgi:hypothetical protein